MPAKSASLRPRQNGVATDAKVLHRKSRRRAQKGSQASTPLPSSAAARATPADAGCQRLTVSPPRPETWAPAQPDTTVCCKVLAIAAAGRCYAPFDDYPVGESMSRATTVRCLLSVLFAAGRLRRWRRAATRASRVRPLCPPAARSQVSRKRATATPCSCAFRTTRRQAQAGVSSRRYGRRGRNSGRLTMTSGRRRGRRIDHRHAAQSEWSVDRLQCARPVAPPSGPSPAGKVPTTAAPLAVATAAGATSRRATRRRP